jgi:hypothetical protein
MIFLQHIIKKAAVHQLLTLDKLKTTQSEPLAKKPRLLEKLLNSFDVHSVLDRINLLSRDFTILAGASAKENDENIEKKISFITFNSIVHRRRTYYQQKIRNQELK